MATLVLLRLCGADRRAPISERRRTESLAGVTAYLARYPMAFANWLQAASLATRGIVELAIAGDPADPATGALLAVATEGARPDLVVAVSTNPAASAIPLLADRTMIDGRPTAYVCRDFACRLPVTDPDALRAQLAERVAI